MFELYNDIMADDDLIDRMVGFNINNIDTDKDGDEYDNIDEVKISKTDEISDLKETIMSMKIMMETMDSRISTLELKVSSLEIDRPKIRHKTTATMPDPDALRHTNSPMFTMKRTNTSTSKNADTDSFTNVSKAKSEISSPATNDDTNTYMNRQPNAAVFTMSNSKLFKNNSAISSRGYENKLTLWGTVFTSLVVGAMKKYIQTTGEVSHIIDELFLMKTYNKIVSELYVKVKFAQLPAVQSHEALLLSKLFKRNNTEEVPESDARTWSQLATHTDGASCMAVIENLFTAAKMVPEAMMHPMSQLIENMVQPVVRESPNGPVFAIPKTTRISNSPNGSERLCMYLKKDSLVVYVRRRLDGDSPVLAAAALVETMKDTDLFDSKHLSRGRDLIRQLSVNGGEF